MKSVFGNKRRKASAMVGSGKASGERLGLRLRSVAVVALASAVSVASSGCTSFIYDVLQFAAAQQCQRYTDFNDYRRCMDSNQVSKEKYDQTRGAASPAPKPAAASASCFRTSATSSSCAP